MSAIDTFLSNKAFSLRVVFDGLEYFDKECTYPSFYTIENIGLHRLKDAWVYLGSSDFEAEAEKLCRDGISNIARVSFEIASKICGFKTDEEMRKFRLEKLRHSKSDEDNLIKDWGNFLIRPTFGVVYNDLTAYGKVFGCITNAELKHYDAIIKENEEQFKIEQEKKHTWSEGPGLPPSSEIFGQPFGWRGLDLHSRAAWYPLHLVDLYRRWSWLFR